MKALSILIYAAGHCDLGPELYNAFTLLRNLYPQQINIAIQLSRPETELLNVLGYSAFHYWGQDDWTGVRRYAITSQGASLIHELGTLSMARPTVLLDFLQWGLTEHPAEHTILVLSGHSLGCVGVLLDYDTATDAQELLSLPSLRRVLTECCRQTRCTIDLLILDTCFANMVELWYEICFADLQPVKNLIVPCGIADRAGLPVLLLEILQSIFMLSRPFTLSLQNLANRYNKKVGLHHSILAIHLRRPLLLELKSYFNDIGGSLCDMQTNIHAITEGNFRDLLSISYLDSCIRNALPSRKLSPANIHEILYDILIAPNYHEISHELTAGPSVLATNLSMLSEFDIFYRQLLFSKDNKWLQAL